MPTQSVTLAWSYGSAALTKTVSLTADGSTIDTISVATGQTVFHYVTAVDVSALSAVYIVSDKAVTLKTNSSGSPDNTITLAANKPLLWYVGCGITNPLTVDVTGIYIANASGSTATIEFRFLQDVTP